MICEHLKDNKCHLPILGLPTNTTNDVCEYCLSCEKPKQLNVATASITVKRLRESNQLDAIKHHHLLEILTPEVPYPKCEVREDYICPIISTVVGVDYKPKSSECVKCVNASSLHINQVTCQISANELERLGKKVPKEIDNCRKNPLKRSSVGTYLEQKIHSVIKYLPFLGADLDKTSCGCSALKSIMDSHTEDENLKSIKSHTSQIVLGQLKRTPRLVIVKPLLKIFVTFLIKRSINESRQSSKQVLCNQPNP